MNIHEAENDTVYIHIQKAGTSPTLQEIQQKSTSDIIGCSNMLCISDSSFGTQTSLCIYTDAKQALTNACTSMCVSM